MQILSIVSGLLGLLLGTLGFLAGSWAVVNVLAFKRSTHTITQMPVVQEETTVTSDLPQHILDQLPSPPERLTAAQYIKWQAAQQAEDDFFNNDE